jgi:hypothetical protein
MPINKNYILVYDTETSSANPYTTQLIEICGQIIEPRTLTRVQDGYFYSLVRPTDSKTVEQGALDVNKKTVSELEKAPELSVIWNEWVSFLDKYNIQKGSQWGAICPAGHNIQSFDSIIMNRMCMQFGPRNAKNNPSLFHPTHFIDTLNISFLFFENNAEVAKLNQGYLLDYFGITKSKLDGAHSAKVDVDNICEVVIRYMKMIRAISPKVQFKDAFKKKSDA